MLNSAFFFLIFSDETSKDKTEKIEPTIYKKASFPNSSQLTNIHTIVISEQLPSIEATSFSGSLNKVAPQLNEKCMHNFFFCFCNIVDNSIIRRSLISKSHLSLSIYLFKVETVRIITEATNNNERKQK